MKRESLLKHLRKHGCYLKREGGAHSLWCNPRTGQVEAVPRGILKSQTFLRRKSTRVFRFQKCKTAPANNSLHPAHLNTDFDIECAQDVSRIVEEFGEDVRVLFHGQIKGHYAASFEVASVFIGADFWRPANA